MTRDHILEGEKAGLKFVMKLPERASSGQAGITSGIHAGSSLDFKDYREYQPGDDLRSIDWQVFGRTDKLTIKMYREEVFPHLDIVVDVSRSMALGGSQKARAAAGLTALLASAAANTGYSWKSWIMGDRIREIGNGHQRPSAWEPFSFDFPGNPAEAINSAPRWRPKAVRVLISDLFWLAEPDRFLRDFGRDAVSVLILQLVADADVTPPLHGNIQLKDVETEEMRDIYVDASVQARYSSNFNRHQEEWNRACANNGSIFASMVAERVVDGWQMEELQAKAFLGVA